MKDKFHDKTDSILDKLVERLSEIYSKAGKDVEKKLLEYLKQFSEEDKQKRKELDNGTLTADQYAEWRKKKMLRKSHWRKLKDLIAKEYSNINQTALAYINELLPKVYEINYNGEAAEINSQVNGIVGNAFELVDANTVRHLATSDETLLPYKDLDGSKDVRWNTQKVNSAVLQGILQGESIPDIAKRLQSVTAMNRDSAIRNARTSITSAECKGRQDMYERAEAGGIHLQREWIASIDTHTRHSHRLLDGQLVDVDKPFRSELGNIMYPGDPSAHPANVYNCRCTVASRVISVNGVQINEAKRKADRFTAKDFFKRIK